VCCSYWLLAYPACQSDGGNPRDKQAIEFMESNAGHTAVCGRKALEGDPHLTTLITSNICSSRF
jgi:hypothetical protein